jgi:hypothetical protein
LLLFEKKKNSKRKGIFKKKIWKWTRGGAKLTMVLWFSTTPCFAIVVRCDVIHIPLMDCALCQGKFGHVLGLMDSHPFGKVCWLGGFLQTCMNPLETLSYFFSTTL